MCFVIVRDLPFFWPFCEAYTRIWRIFFSFLILFVVQKSTHKEMGQKSFNTLLQLCSK